MAFLPQPQESAEPEETEEIIVGDSGTSHTAAATEEDTTIDVHTTRGAPIRYLPLDHLYSATSPCSGSSNVMSKKVKARKLPTHFPQNDDVTNTKTTTTTTAANNTAPSPALSLPPNKPPVIFVYSRRRKRGCGSTTTSFYDSVLGRVGKDPGGSGEERVVKRRKIGTTELEKLGVDLGALKGLDGPRLRECRNNNNNNHVDGERKGGGGSLEKFPKLVSESRTVKRWVG